MKRSIRVTVADDHALFRQGLRSLLRLQSNIEIVGEVERVEGILPSLAKSPCDVLLLDLQMDRSTLIDIEELSKRTAVLVVTASEFTDDARSALRAGARGVVFKRFAVDTLIEALEGVARGDVWMPPSLQAALAAGLRDGEDLTVREREIVRHVALGLRNAEVAKKLFISEQTVKTHLNNVFQKLGIRDRVELTLYAIRNGIIAAHERPS